MPPLSRVLEMAQCLPKLWQLLILTLIRHNRLEHAPFLIPLFDLRSTVVTTFTRGLRSISQRLSKRHSVSCSRTSLLRRGTTRGPEGLPNHETIRHLLPPLFIRIRVPRSHTLSPNLQSRRMVQVYPHPRSRPSLLPLPKAKCRLKSHHIIICRRSGLRHSIPIPRIAHYAKARVVGRGTVEHTGNLPAPRERKRRVALPPLLS
jgi:hypothetical protein